MKKFFFGTGRRNINPKVPCSLAGYFNLRMWDKQLDDIEVRALALKQGDVNFLIVQADLLAMNEHLYNLIRKEISGLGQFDEKNVLFTATHTHTAPDTFPGSQGNNPEYDPFVAKLAGEAIRDAVANLREGRFLSTTTSDDRFEFNRRYWMKGGGVVTNPGKLNKNILRPEGAVDYEIPVFGIESDGKLEVVLANIVNHTDTTDGTAVSADWAGHTRRMVESKMSGESPVCFPLIGCAGNINHFDVSTDRNQTSPAEAKRIGSGYAKTIVKAFSALEPAEDFTMRTAYAGVECVSAEIPASEIAEAKAVMKKYASVPDPLESGVSITSEDLANKAPVALKYFAASLLKAAESKEKFRFRLTGVSFGNAMIASLPSEPFVEIGLDIRKRFFADRLCMVVSHGNGTGCESCGGGYIPNFWNYNRGGYETTARSNPFEHHFASYLREAWAKISIEKGI